MKNIHYFVIALFIFGVVSCCKDDSACFSRLEDQLVLDTHYNNYFCDLENFTKIYNTTDEFYADELDCFYADPIPFPINFKGLILAQGVKVKYAPGAAYDKSIEIEKNECDKILDFHFILHNVDTTKIIEHNENVLVVLDGIDSSYQVVFSHEIIPFGG